jgi:hypothetical protein
MIFRETSDEGRRGSAPAADQAQNQKIPNNRIAPPGGELSPRDEIMYFSIKYNF